MIVIKTDEQGNELIASNVMDESPRDYMTDANEALRVWAKCKRRGCIFAPDENAPSWCVETFWTHEEHGTITHETTAQTFCHAICAAALGAVNIDITIKLGAHDEKAHTDNRS